MRLRMRNGLILLSALALLATGCGNGETPEEPGSADQPDALEGFRIGLALPTTADDHHWSYRMAQEAEAFGEDTGVEVQVSSAVFDPTEAEPVIRQFIDGGYDVIIAHSFSHEPVVRELAPQFPDIPFALAADSGDPPDENMVIYTYSYLQMGYTMCWLGAQLSESGVLGIAGADEVPFNTETNEGCRVGAEEAVPGIEVIEAFSGDFFDQQRGREVAQSLVDQGADVIFESGGTDSSLGAFAFCEEQDLICMGTVADQSEIAPNSVVASTVIDWRTFLSDLVGQVSEGTFEASEYSAAFQNEGLSAIAFEGPAADKVPQELQDSFW
jgi:basic membrane protein A